MAFAHLFKVSALVARTTGHKYQLIITESAQPIGGVTIPCDGSRHGKQLAKAHKATPYNF